MGGEERISTSTHTRILKGANVFVCVHVWVNVLTFCLSTQMPRI